MLIAKRNNPVQEDFVKLVENDLKDVGVSYEQVTSSQMTKSLLKIICKRCSFQTSEGNSVQSQKS